MTRPPLELVWDSEGGSPFEALLRAAATDPEAASGLALAYVDMPREAREKLIASIPSDDPNALLLLLGVEEEPDLAWQIADVLLRHAPPRPDERRDAAFRWGDATAGGIGLVRHLHGAFADGLRVEWSTDGLRTRSVPIGRAEDLEALRVEAEIPEAAQSVPFELAVDALTEMLWRHRREGRALPSELRPFAELFSVAPRRKNP